jgi:hypothetical protein
MTIRSDLLPELTTWNGGSGINAEDWILSIGRTSDALGYAALFWPDFVALEAFVLRGPVNVERLREWQTTDATAQQIEAAMNMLFLENVFPEDDASEHLREARVSHLAAQMAEMLSAKLEREFPDRKFSVLVIDDEDDFGVTFHQA